MYLSKLHLRNWRVYEDATFEFNRPTKKRPIIFFETSTLLA